MPTLFDLPFDDADPPDTPVHDETPPPPRVVSVSELTASLRELVEARFPEVWVEGELSGARLWNTGHLYFALKDAGAQLKGVMFRSAARTLRFRPEDGLRVVARGRISVYDPRGEYQLVCEHLEPQGLGALQLAFEQLKRRLAAEGLFDTARKRPLPALPRRIGIVTSIDGAALRDIIKVLRRRYPNAHVVIAPSRVQGEGAAAEIAAALGRITRVDDVDVVIVGRGGGSLEDLWAFNEEAVARAIAASPVPVISAVGHETDTTIADFVADLRAPTPSAAAELVVERKDGFTAQIDRLHDRLDAAVDMRLQRLATRLHRLEARPAFAGIPARVAVRGRHLADLGAALRRLAAQGVQRRRRTLEGDRRRLEAASPERRLTRVRATLAGRETALHAAITRRVERATARLGRAATGLESLSPLAVLGRGYALCWTADRTALVRDAAAVPAGTTVHVRVHRGELDCTVTGSRT